LIFLIIGIIGYFTIPSVANYIVNAGGGNALLYKVSNMFSSTAKTVVNTGGAGLNMASGAINRVAGTVSSEDSKGGLFGRTKTVPLVPEAF